MAINEKKILERGYVLYSDFGAVGDGLTDDFEAVFAAHEYANERGLDVKADEGKTFYFHTFSRPAVIKTNTDFTGAFFTVDDRGDQAFADRSTPLFLVDKDEAARRLTEEDIKELAGAVSVAKGSEKIEWLSPFLRTKSLVWLHNANHRDFVRFGSNVNSGNPRSDVFLIDKDGTVDPSTPIIYDYDTVTAAEIYAADDKPITVRGGTFTTICCSVVAATDFENRWRGYYRAFKIVRANTTLEDMSHTVICEPYIESTGYGRGRNGKLSQSYPYYGFLYFYNTVNSSAKRCALQGHTTYYEDKKTSDKPVPQGTYDLVIEYSSHVYIEGITNGVDISDKRYWGLMSSNGAKNLFFRDCSMSRFDAHRGFWNAELINCEFGQTINVIGGGRLYMENVTRHTGAHFIALRNDYGATFDGEVILKNCRHLGKASYRGAPKDELLESISIIHAGFAWDKEKYLDWDFGYTCYMPRKVVIEGYETPIPSGTAVFNFIGDAAFSDSIKNKYMITESVTFIGDNNFEICKDAGESMKSIPIIRK